MVMPSTEEILETLQSDFFAVSSQNMTIEYPVIERELLTPQEAALEYVVENVPVDLSLPDDSWRLVQRYALCVFWFATSSAQDGKNAKPWFARSTDDECWWKGISCDEAHRIVGIDAKAMNLVGALPEDFGLLTDLTVLNLAENSFQGELPTVLQALLNLAILDITKNAFTGSLFLAFLGDLQLRQFKATDNRFGGPIPSALGNQTGLDTLHVERNQGITGTIPTSLGALTALTSFHLGGSGRITGELPAFLPTLTKMRDHLVIFDLGLPSPANQDL